MKWKANHKKQSRRREQHICQFEIHKMQSIDTYQNYIQFLLRKRCILVVFAAEVFSTSFLLSSVLAKKEKLHSTYIKCDFIQYLLCLFLSLLLCLFGISRIDFIYYFSLLFSLPHSTLVRPKKYFFLYVHLMNVLKFIFRMQKFHKRYKCSDKVFESHCFVNNRSIKLNLIF